MGGIGIMRKDHDQPRISYSDSVGVEVGVEMGVRGLGMSVGVVVRMGLGLS